MSLTFLALDSSTEACSVALWVQNKLFETYELAPRQHNKLLLPMVQDLLNKTNLSLSQIDVLAFGCGPGSFTGLRIAASIIQGIAFAHDLPVVPISTLRTIAQGLYRETQAEYVLPALDAAMGEIYYGFYHTKNNLMVNMAAESLGKPQEIQLPDHKSQWLGAGNGWDLYHEILVPKLAGQLQQWLPGRYPRASDMIALARHDYELGKAVSAEAVLPVYLRDEIFKK